MVKSVRLAAAALALAALVAACGGGDDKSDSSATKSAANEPVTIEWWHISNNEPMKSIWADGAKEYMAAHPNVKINITVLENEAFKSKLTTTMQSGKVPDMFQSWGGGTLKEQADAGLVQDVSEPTKPWIGDLNKAAAGLYNLDGQQYGIPFNLGMVGVWYRKSLFEKAGIDGPPATWAEFLADIDTLKKSGVTPLAVGAKDKWPGMFWWANLSLRIAGKDAMAQAGEDGSFDSAGFVKAGEELKKLIDMQPFQKGFLAAPWDGAGGEAATIANGKAAMDLMGQWAPSTFAANAKDGDTVLKDLGWFPFPTVDGGAGQASEQFGGGDGFAFGKDAPPEAVDFAKFLVTSHVATKAGASGAVLPVLNGAESSVTDPNMKSVLDARANAEFVQLYLDQAYAPAVGQAVNDAVAELFAGKSSPQDVAGQIADAAKAG
jgi:raffinose/stachyose/melibiose transport system substrate-binding protein